ncbi:hypothetical protein ACL598_06920 [Bordetella bronchialis]|uniref:hypothetical protein n=1 Tax=Bordetella bronchialis TaxID=463025 RepID=UPI003D049B87
MYAIHAAGQPAPSPIETQQPAPFRAGVAPPPRARTRMHRPARPPLTLQLPARHAGAVGRVAGSGPGAGSPAGSPVGAPSCPASGSPLSAVSTLSLPFPFLGVDRLLDGLDPEMRLAARDVMRDDDIFGAPPSGSASPPELPQDTRPPAAAARHAALSDPEAPSRRRNEAWRRSLLATLNMGPKRDITREVIREASRRLACHPANLRGFARAARVSQQALRSFVDGCGRLTDLGRAVDRGTLLTPADRRAANLPDIERKTTLQGEDFALAGKLIKLSVGGLSRSLFCDLYGYDRATIYRAYQEDGSLTEWGRAQRDALGPGGHASPATLTGPVAELGVAPPTGPVRPGPAARDGTAPGMGSPLRADMPARQRNGHWDPETAARHLSALASREGIALAYWHEASFRKLGKTDAPLAGNVDQAGERWRICPAGGGDYRVPAGEQAMEHIVNILRLHAHGHVGRLALAAEYTLVRPTPRGPIFATPKAGAPDAARARAAAGAR